MNTSYKEFYRTNTVYFFLSTLTLSVLLALSSCSNDDDSAGPCDNTDLAVTAIAGDFSLEATGAGGTPPYEFSIDGATFQSTGTFTNLLVQEYTLTVRDNNECTATITAAPRDGCPASDLAVTAVPGDLSLEAAGAGGVSPYEYSIDGTSFQPSGSFTDLTVQDYTVTVRDVVGCTATFTIAGTSIDPCFKTDLQITAFGLAFDITASAAGGNAPYEFSVDGVNFQSSGDFFDLGSADYTVTVRDSKGCTSTKFIAEENLKIYVDPRDNEVYGVDRFGDQVWFTRSLRFEPAAGSSCYENNLTNCENDGRLYNWHALANLAPEGWHVPTAAEWATLVGTAGGTDAAGKELREGVFGAELAGSRHSNGNYSNINSIATFWTSDEVGSAISRGIYYSMYMGDTKANERDIDKNTEFTVRLVKD